MTKFVKAALYKPVPGRSASEEFKLVDEAMRIFAPASGISWKLVPAISLERAFDAARFEGACIGGASCLIGFIVALTVDRLNYSKRKKEESQ